MHRSTLSRRAFLSLSGAAGAGALASGLFPNLAKACLPPPDPLKAAKDLAGGINAFAHDLHARLAKDAKGDLFFSPFSIEAALAMTAAGARGDTYDEMRKVLHLPLDPHPAFGALINHLTELRRAAPQAPGASDAKAFRCGTRGYELTVANAIWAQKGFPWHKEFTELTQKHYGAGLTEVDFAEPEAARELINAWVEKETREKIKNLIGPNVLDRLTRMVLANAIYFKGAWLYRFDKKQTKDAPFTRADGTKADVPLMSQTAELNYCESSLITIAVGERQVTRVGEKVQVLELPYAGKELSMLVFLPETATGTDWLAEWITPERLARIELARTEVRVELPRFKVESELSLKPALMDLGMKAAFAGADFTGMSPKGKALSISHVLHKAFVEVNEEGTEAAAATAVVIKEPSAPPEPKTFRADRPFVFAIRDTATGAVLFLGRYTGPSK
jgi:serpin B